RAAPCKACINPAGFCYFTSIPSESKLSSGITSSLPAGSSSVIPEGGSLQSLHKPCGFLLFYLHSFRKQAFFGLAVK
ncbi:MAG TPA: hypothetical protein PLS58_09165, partial [Bacteroidales bacterium]|nr:hypothetical protein [Bacteroidales bacterium]